MNDLATLRQLLTYLLSFDAVSFNQYLETILASNTTNFSTGKSVVHQSPWLFLPAADIILETARERVYKKVAIQPDHPASPNNGVTQAKKAGKQKVAESAEVERAVNNGNSDDDEYWDGREESIFENESLLAATQSEPSQKASSNQGTSAQNGTSARHKTHIHDLTKNGPEDNTADAFRSILGPKEADGGSQGSQSLPEDIYASRQAQKMPWAYWSPEGTIPILEEQPKWFVLREILDEIENQIHWTPVSHSELSEAAVNDTILIMCSSIRTVTTLRKYLSSIPELNREASNGKAISTGGKDLLTDRAAEYFLWKGSMGRLSRGIKTSGTATIAGIVYEQGAPSGADNTTAKHKIATAMSNDNDTSYMSAALKRKSAYKHGQLIGKRRRVRGGGTGYNPNDRASAQAKVPSDGPTSVLEAEAEELADSMAHQGVTSGVPSTLQDIDEDFDPIAFSEYFGLLETEETIVIRAYADDEDDRILEELRPRYVIMYDPDPAFVRRLEVGHLHC